MNLDNFTLKAQEAIAKALKIAAGENHQGLEPVHVLKAFLSEPTGIVVSIIKRIGADIHSLDAEVDAAIKKLPVVTGASASGQYWGNDTKAVFDTAQREARALKDDYVSSEHLLIALTTVKEGAGQALHRGGVTRSAVLKVIERRVTDQHAEDRYRALERFTRNLNNLAADGKIDPVIGRG